MNQNVQLALKKLFEKHRIIFWYDANKELRSEFESLTLDSVEKLEINNNEYRLKYKILRENPEQRFLIYKEDKEPAHLDNWLLDVQLSNGVFRTDQTSIWLSDLELGIEFSGVVQKHEEFFRSSKRREILKKNVHSSDTESQIRLNMLAVCTGCEPRIDIIAEHLLQELSERKDEKYKLIDRCNLTPYLWDQFFRCYGYESDEPSIRDFAIELFKSCYAMGTDEKAKLSSEALVFLKRWKDSRQFESGFERISKECAEVLDIESDLLKRDLKDLLELDYFQLIDQKIIRELVEIVINRTESAGNISVWIRQRRQSHWYPYFEHIYEAIDNASKLISTLSDTLLVIDSIFDGVKKYSTTWFRIDQMYRRFIYHVKASTESTLLANLIERIENAYTNDFLLKLGDRFQEHLDAMSEWNAYPIPSQRFFFNHWVSPFLKRENRVCVIISDALRYEIGDELLSRIRQEDKFSAELDVALSTLPSYTQLGMAALLPNTSLSIESNSSAGVIVDGLNSMGLYNRENILSKLDGLRSIAVKANTILSNKQDDLRNTIRDNDVLYVYHNLIDLTGDKLESEENVFNAVESSLEELLKVIKKLTNANASNILVTSDHGFIYQNRALEESDFSIAEPEGEHIYYRDRRFILGKGLKPSKSLLKLESHQVGLTGDLEIQIPKSINRLRLKGSGSRFVHGGATLQEVVIPVIRINKKRQSDVSSVDVEILRSSSNIITSGQIAVILYQSSPVNDKTKPRILRAGIFTEDGELISDSHTLNFDLTSENPREREYPIRFLFSRKADEVNGKEVILKLEEQHEGTSHYKVYKSIRYTMKRSFTSDFDF